MDLATIVPALPKLDVVPALDSDLRNWAVKVAKFIECPPQSAEDPHELVVQPLSSHRYSMTLRHTLSGNVPETRHTHVGEEEVTEGEAALGGSQEKRTTGRIRKLAYRREPETLREQLKRKTREDSSCESKAGYQSFFTCLDN